MEFLALDWVKLDGDVRIKSSMTMIVLMVTALASVTSSARIIYLTVLIGVLYRLLFEEFL